MEGRVMQASEASPVLTQCSDGVAEIRFNRPQHMNALDVPTASGFLDAVNRVTNDPATRVILITGAGDNFLAGGDLVSMREAGDRAVDVVDALITPMHQALELLADAPQPSLASLQGAVAGAGVSIALATDLAIAADNVRFNLAYINIGAVPDCSGSWQLPRVVGMRKALEIALLGETIPVDEAARLGMVNRVVPLDELTQATANLARRLAAGPPVALAGTRRLVRDSLARTLHDQLAAEEATFKACAVTEDFQEGLTAFFERRKPRFTGR
jgi:2-(1,2-epoxy-1,2-dihydrophenyl)acetyl-CoA isomerase